VYFLVNTNVTKYLSNRDDIKQQLVSITINL